MGDISYPPADLTGVMAAIPQPATVPPIGVADTSAVGNQPQYARADHVHASKARKQIVTMSSASSTYLWTYPTAFGSGVTPICSAIVQVPSGTTDLYNVQIVGTPSNTQVMFQINRVSTGLIALVTGALSVNPAPVAATLHMIALEP